jgi:YD repeat-containing protein
MTNYRIGLKLFTAFALIVQTVYAQKTDWEKMNLKGKIKSIVQIEYQIGEDTEDESRMIYSFNTGGYLTNELSEDRMGNLIYKKTYAYDKQKRISSETEVDNLVGVTINTTNKYNAAGKLEKVTVKVKKDVIKTYIYTYGSDGNISNIKLLKPAGLITENFARKYDANGNLTEEIHTEGNEYKKLVYRYDEHNRLTAKEEYNKSDRMRYKTEYEYDPSGNVSRESSGYVGGSAVPTVFNYVYEYDKDGNWTSVREQSEGKTFNVVMRRIAKY